MRSLKATLYSLLESFLYFGAQRIRSNRIFSFYVNEVCKKEYSEQVLATYNERPVEYGFVFKHLSRYYPTTILDVGTGTTALPSLMRACGFVVTAIDNIRDYWTGDMVNRHYYIIEDDITDTSLQTKFDLITCISVLEHIRDFNSAVGNIVSLLNPGGYLVMTFPYCETGYVPNVYELPNSAYGKNFPFATQAFSRNELDYWIDEFAVEIVDQEFWRFWSGDYWTIGSQLIPPCRTSKNESHQLSCLLLRKNEVSG